MKKLFALILCITAFLVIGTVAVAAANMINTGEYYMIEADKMDEITAGEAGEKTVAWEVPFLHISPKLDGTINKNEYLPFELYEDYMTWLVSSNDPTAAEPPNTTEDFDLFYEATQNDFVKPYWGWDGAYLYLAFEVNLINGYTCTPEVMGGDMYLWAYNCLQVGIAPAEAVGTNDYIELGYGVHSETGDSLVFNWYGNYLPEAGTDFVGVYDDENQVLRYEMRLHLQTVLGLSDRTVENGDEMNYGWLMSVNGETTGPYDVWHLMFCRGISGPLSKNAALMARVTFTGKPDGFDVPVVEIPGMSEEDLEYGLKEYIDFSDEAAVNTFEGENAAVDYVTEGEESFMRITSLSIDDYAYVVSSKYPRNIVGGQADYIVIKYRTSSEKGDQLGMIYRTVLTPDYDLEYCYYDTVGTDGEWHTIVFYMTGEPGWEHFILNLGLVPFYEAENSVQETFDVAWIKFYAYDPTDLYEDSAYDGSVGTPVGDATEEETEEDTDLPVADTEENAAETAEDPDGDTTAAPAETNASENNDVTAPSADNTGDDIAATTTAPAGNTTDPVGDTTAASAEGNDTTDSSDESQGCASVLSFGAIAVLAVASAAVALKKKDD